MWGMYCNAGYHCIVVETEDFVINAQISLPQEEQSLIAFVYL